MSREKGNSIVSIIIGLGVLSLVWVSIFGIYDWIQEVKRERSQYNPNVRVYSPEVSNFSPEGYSVNY